MASVPTTDAESLPATSLATLKVFHKAEAWDMESGTFAFWEIVWTDGEDYFSARYPSRELPGALDALTPSLLNVQPQLIPRTYFRAALHADLTPAPAPLPADSYIKTPAPVAFDPDEPASTGIADLLVKEARVCEVLAAHPHPNVCEYRGYVEKDGFMTGLCLKRYGKDLHTAVQDGDPVDVEAVVSGIRRGLEHLHRLGLIHCDINPSNIVLDSASVPVIVDFDSCHREGARIVGKGGTSEWSRGPDVAEIEEDLYGLEKIDAWLQETREECASVLKMR